MHDSVAVIERWHRERWPVDCATSCGYHFFIRHNGTLQESRDLELIPVAQGGHNTGSIALCLHGLTESTFSKAQFATLNKLCREIYDAYEGQITFHGHCEVSTKSCPVFDYRKVLNLDPFGRMNNGKKV